MTRGYRRFEGKEIRHGMRPSTKRLIGVSIIAATGLYAAYLKSFAESRRQEPPSTVIINSTGTNPAGRPGNTEGQPESQKQIVVPANARIQSVDPPPPAPGPGLTRRSSTVIYFYPDDYERQHASAVQIGGIAPW